MVICLPPFLYTLPYTTRLGRLYGGVYTALGEVRHIMGVTRTPRDRWIEEGLRALADGGPDAVRVEALAKRLGVTKGGFYGFFADRDALLTAMLDLWERESTDDVLERIESAGGDPKDKIRRAGALT